VLNELLGELRRNEEKTEGTRALPLGCYADLEFFEAELEHVLRPGWHALARWDELPEPGDYRSIDLLGERVLLVRGRDGELRAMSGVCLHRAFPLAEGEGNTNGFVCPYHRWAYDLEGRLKGAPFMDEVPGFDRTACQLPQLPLEIWQGFVMVSTNLQVPPLASQLNALSKLLAPLGLEGAVHVGVTDWDSPWNWKVMIDNFMESYHHIGPHVDSLGKSHPARGTHDIPIEGPCAVLENPSLDGDSPFFAIHIFPTLMFAPSRGEMPLCAWYEMQIDRHDHIRLRIHLLLPEPLAGNEQWVDAALERLRTIHLEDIPACQGIQRGIQSRIWQPGLLSRQEATLSHFRRFLIDRLTSAIQHPE